MMPNSKPRTPTFKKKSPVRRVATTKSSATPVPPPPITFPTTLNTYLGKKGYTITKSELSKEQQDFIIDKLTIKPFTLQMGGGPSYGANQPTYPVYRESAKKYYVPRFFGETYMGLPKETTIPEGDDIQLEFNGKLRDNQVPVVEAFMSHIHKTPDTGAGGLLELPCAYGKCLARDTPILMFDGSVKAVQDVEVGDLLMGDDSTPRKVLSLARGREKMYKVVDNTYGEEYVVNASHILSLKDTNNKVVDMCITDYLRTREINAKSVATIIPIHPICGTMVLQQNILNELKGYRVPVIFPPQRTSTDPYTKGYFYGLTNNLEDAFHKMSEKSVQRRFRISHNYKCNSLENRKKLLFGIIDSNGGRHFGSYYYVEHFYEQFANDVLYVSRSIGINAKKIYYKTTNKWGIQIYTPKLNSVMRDGMNERHIEYSPITESKLKYRIEIEELEEDDYYGFMIDGNRRFLLGDFTVTHNTTISLNLISQIKKKTIVIVHKEFLLNQWMERIGEFLPSARVGRIQGSIIDIEDKDIVIGMLQSICMKEYDPNIFDGFGLLIIDEVHHISSEVFSRALFKIMTKYMLGLSATMERKDGTTFVFKMFLGDVVYKGSRDEEHDVVVRGIEYKTNDTEFNEVEYDFRGNPQYSKMITKICEYGPRSDFIVKVVEDLLLENDKKQIMVIAHNRSLLKYLYDAIEYRELGSVGYYVGGMKERDLKETEGKKIVLATYQMAAEGLDIKTLSVLVMATPKTDIVQTVGRILRVKHSQPVVVDIIDSHELFQNQWRQRVTYYKKCNYNVRKTDTIQYMNSKKEGKLPCNDDKIWKITYKSKEKNVNNGGETHHNMPNMGKVDVKNTVIGKCLLKMNIEELEQESEFC
jgi:superfamily II DNA or RNA helicase